MHGCPGPRKFLERRGTILVVVLVVVVLLTLAAAHYASWMTTELEAAAMTTADVQARMLADSGAEYVAALLANQGEPGSDNYLHNPELFLGINVQESDFDRTRGRFTIIAPLEQDDTATRVRYGLIDESAKLNLNLLDQLDLDDEESRTLLLGLPYMTEEIADAIRDWIDSDDTSREYGVESEYYESLTPAYAAKNGPLETIDELLLVKDVTPELLYGEDANRNGLLDPNEDDGDASPPYDNADGVLQLGWISFLTVYSREVNIRSDGTAKIDLNNGILTDLYDQLEEEFGEEFAAFVVAYRINGPLDQPPVETSSVASTSTQAQQEKQANEALQGFAGAAAGAATNAGGQVTRGNPPQDLAGGAKFQIKSVWELLGEYSRAKTNYTAGATNKELTSPLASGFEDQLPDLLDKLTVSPDTYLEGRININQARREVLIGLPNMTETIVDAILAAQPVDADGQPDTDVIASRSTTGWLFTEGLVDIWGMRALDPFITSHGDVYRAQIMGFFDGGGPVSRIEVIVDGTEIPPRVVFHRDLDALGRGYTRQQFFPGQ